MDLVSRSGPQLLAAFKAELLAGNVWSIAAFLAERVRKEPDLWAKQ
jgi:hypothetical protein